MKQYKISFGTGAKRTFMEISGHPVKIEGFEGIEFFAHRDKDDPEFWKVSEATTGALVSLRANIHIRKTDAIRAAKEILERHGIEAVKEKLLALVAK